MPGRSARTLLWIREQLVFLIVLAGLAASFMYLLVEPGHWVRGTAAMATVVLAAGLARLALPMTSVGFLAVRNRWLDVFCYLLFGGLILAVDIRLRR